MSEKLYIEIYSVEERLPDTERMVIAWDSFIEQWREATYFFTNWMDSEGLDFREGQITRWFDLPEQQKILELEVVG